jgi:TetR/AcrR family transcriptional regulator, transcriptional repressor for nem operon
MATTTTAPTAPTKGERTRQRIVERCAPVFNQLGYAGASMRDLVEATGLEKGGLYNHFGSKEALAVASFDHSVSLVADGLTRARASSTDAVDQLVATIHAFASWARKPGVAGGCPIMNTAIEADDTNPELHAHARDAMARWHRLIGAIVKDGKAARQIDPEADPYVLATIMTASLEGALMLTRLHDDPAHMDRVVDHLVAHVEALRPRRARRSPRSSG